MSTKSWETRVNTELRTYVDGVLTATNPGNYPGKSYSRTGVTNPDWRRQVLTGENASTNMTVDIVEVDFKRSWSVFYAFMPWPPVNGHSYSTQGVLQPYWAKYTYPVNLGSWENLTLQRASQVFLKRLKEADRKFQGGVFFGEIVPTIKMLVRPFGSLRDGLKSYFRAVHKRGKGKRGDALQKILGDTWLEYSFGWKPLQADIHDATGALIDVYANLRKTRLKADADDTMVPREQSNSDSTVNLVFYKVRRNWKVDYSVRFYGALNPLPNGEAGLPSLERIKNQSGFRFSDFIPTVWELIPYSFLIDYFSNIGDVLTAYATDTSELKRLSMVEIRSTEVTEEWIVDHLKQYIGTIGYPPGKEVTPPPLTQMWLGGQGGATTIRSKQIIRWPFGSLTYPGLRFELPVKATQFANMGALLAGSRKYRG